MDTDERVLSLLDLLQTHSRSAAALPSQKDVEQLQDAVVGLSSEAGLDLQGPAVEDAATCIELLVQQLLVPPSQLFSGLGGAPCEPEMHDLGALQLQATACRLQLLLLLLRPLGSIDMPAADEQGGRADQQREEDRRRNRPQYVIGIVEIVEEEDDDSSKQTPEQQLQARLQQALLQLLLACALYAASNSSSSGGGSAANQPGCCSLDAYCSSVQQQALQLHTPWSDQRCQAGCQALLQQLSAQLKLPDAAPAGASPGSAETGTQQQEQPQQRLLGGLLPLLVGPLRDPLLAQHRHKKAEERAEIGGYKGPDVFHRCLPARQLAWLCLQLRSPALDEHFGRLLPLVLAVTDDPSPSVQRYGHAMLSWLAGSCRAATLRWQDVLLGDSARRVVVGCEESCWATGMPAATALVMALEGKDVRAPGYHSLLSELLSEAERSAHKPQQRLVFMACLAALLPRLGLYCVRHFARLMPLLLEWLHAYDAASAVVAVQVLGRVVRQAWPRMPAHAAIIWQNLVQLMAAAAAKSKRKEPWQEGSSEQQAARGISGTMLEALVELVQCLQACGGEAFVAAVAATDAEHKAAMPAQVAALLS